MEYNEISKGEDAKELLLEGIEDLATAVLATMGPMGRTVIIQDEYGRPYVTKDGVSVANAIKFKNPVKNIAATLIKEVAQKTADEAGDGTTTSICLAQAFVRHGMEKLEHETCIVDLQNAIDNLVKDTLKDIKRHSRKLSKKNINKVATISANNDKEIGALIQKAYNHSLNVKVEEGKNSQDSIELVDGMVHEISYVDNGFITDEKKKEVNFEKPYILIVDGKVSDLAPFEYIIQKADNEQRPVAFFVEDMTEQCINRLLSIKNRLQTVVVKAPGFGQYRKDHLKDIATFTGGKVIHRVGKDPLFESWAGTAKRLVVNKMNTVITKLPELNIDEAIKDLEIQKKEAKLNDYDREFINSRIDNLTGSMAVISVGGSSEVEMRERKDRIDDAVLAVKSALAEGIVEGGGLALLKVYNTLVNSEKGQEDELYRAMAEVLLSPSFQIYMNSDGKINCEVYDDRFKKGIIDPLKVTRCALENAASVAKTILSTEAVVLNQALWN
jgi:chaperonin GroEL